MARIWWSAAWSSVFVVALWVAGAAKANDAEEPCSCADAGPQECCDICDHCHDCYPWLVSADAVFLQRAALDRTILLQPSGGVGTSASAARASDFNFNYEPGADITLVRFFNNDRGGLDAIDVRYLGVNGSDDSFQTFLPTGDNVPFKAFQPFGNGAPQNWNLGYQSDLQSVEINAHYDCPSNLTFLAGVRWVELNDHLSMDSNAPSISQNADFDFGAKNDLVGFQIGLHANTGPSWGSWRLDGALKAGVYNDSARNSFGVAVNGTPNVFFASDSTDQVVFVGEILIKLQFVFSERLIGEIGWQTLWLDGIAVAGDQIPATNIVTHSGIDTSGHAFYQGASAGLTVRF